MLVLHGYCKVAGGSFNGVSLNSDLLLQSKASLMAVLAGLGYRGRMRTEFLEHVKFCPGAKDLPRNWERGTNEDKISIFPSST